MYVVFLGGVIFIYLLSSSTKYGLLGEKCIKTSTFGCLPLQFSSLLPFYRRCSDALRSPRPSAEETRRVTGVIASISVSSFT